MAGLIPQNFIDDLLARTDIVGVIEARVPLKRAGRNWTACCPFHKEKTPSFTVSPDKQFYYCFGCGATGNALGFLMDYERRSFPEAVEELAARAGLTVPHDSGGDDSQQSRYRILYDLLAQADRHYQEQLRKHALRARAVDYLKGRGLTGEIARRFGLGYAPPGWDHLLAALGSDDARRAQLTECGLLVAQDGKLYDRFRDRVMFPIRDLRGRVIGFGGRVIGDGKPKYLNSPETPVFHKGRELYGLYEAKQSSRQLERLLVVEGYMDVIALAQQGIQNAVATLGTACTSDHVDLLFRHAPEIVFCFDGDNAGRKAAWRALEATLPKMQDGRSARVLFLPEGHDPDSLVRAEGPDAFAARVAGADSLDDVLLAELSSRVDLARSDGLARLAALARPYVMQIPGEVLRALVTQKLADLTHVDPRLLAGTPARPTPADGQPGDPHAGMGGGSHAMPDDIPPGWDDHGYPASRDEAGNNGYANNDYAADDIANSNDRYRGKGNGPGGGGGGGGGQGRYRRDGRPWGERGRFGGPASRVPRRPPPRGFSVAGHIVRRLMMAPELGRGLQLLPELRGLDLPDVGLLCEVIDILNDSEHPSVAALFGRLRGSEHEEALADLAGREFLAGTPDTEAGLQALREDIAGGLRQLELAWWDGEIARELRNPAGADTARLRDLYARQQALKAAVRH